MSLNLAHLKRTLLYQARARIPIVQAALQDMRQLDVLQEQLRKKWMITGLATLLLAIGAGVVSITVAVPPSLSPGQFMAGAVFFLGFSVVSFGVMIWQGRLDVENRRYELAGRLLQLLEADTAEEAELDIQIDLRKPDRKEKFARQDRVGPWKVRYYVDPWLSLKGRLLDGTRYSLTVLEKLQKRSKWKRSRSGKMKHKSKTKSALEAVLLLHPKPDRYLLTEGLRSEIQGAVQLPAWARLKALAAQEDTLMIRTFCDGHWAVPDSGRPRRSHDATQMIALMFLSLYQVLNLARTLQKGREKEKES